MNRKFIIVPTGQIDAINAFQVTMISNGHAIGVGEMPRTRVNLEVMETLKSMLDQGTQVQVEFTTIEQGE